MREILFRGKRIDNGNWAEGCYSKGFLFPEQETLRDFIYMFSKESGKWEFDYAVVDPETVSQYTGTTDKNGKKIYEGDIIEIRGYVYCCRWDEGNLEFMLANKKENFGMGYAASSRMNVIGNVHDNPELLGGSIGFCSRGERKEI